MQLPVASLKNVTEGGEISAKVFPLISDIIYTTIFCRWHSFIEHLFNLDRRLMNTKGFRLLFFFLFLISLLPVMGWADDDRTIELTVVKNDNLINLCGKYLEDPSRWPEIGRINRLRDFDLIHPGKILIIPIRLLKGVPMAGRVLFIKGDVTVQTAKGNPWKVLLPNDLVHPGHLIRTGRESAVEIAFDDGTSFFQRSETTLGLNTANRRGGSHIFQQLSLEAGRMLMKVRRATGQESRIEIQTPSATAVARGTDFRVSVDSAEAMTSEVIEGTVDVEAMKQSVVLKEGEGTLVKKGEPPLKPRKLLPPPSPLDLRPLYRTMPVVLKFGEVKDAAAYRLQLSTDPEGRDVIREKAVGVAEALELDRLEDGTYYLQGRSIDGIGIEGLPLAPQAVRVRVHPLPPFTREPADGTQFKGKSVSFRWMKVPNAARYELQISPDLGFRDLPGKSAQTDAVSHEQTFADFGSYFFRIRSLALDGYEGIWSDTIAFTLIPPPSAPSLEKPAVDDQELRIRWRSQGEKMSYRCQIALEDGFLNPIIERKVDRPEISLPKPEAPGIYYVRTSTIDPTGYEGGFSPPQSFEIKPPVVVKEVKKDCTNAYILGTSIVGILGVLLLILL
jgi:hypothetical protein